MIRAHVLMETKQPNDQDGNDSDGPGKGKVPEVSVLPVVSGGPTFSTHLKVKI